MSARVCAAAAARAATDEKLAGTKQRCSGRRRLQSMTPSLRCVVVLLMAVPVVSSATACTGSSLPGTIIGTVREYGGPAIPGKGQAMNGQGQPGVTVSLWQNSHQVATVTTDTQGRFTVKLAPGTYVINGCGGSVPVGDAVTIVEGQTVTHDVKCSIP